MSWQPDQNNFGPTFPNFQGQTMPTFNPQQAQPPLSQDQIQARPSSSSFGSPLQRKLTTSSDNRAHLQRQNEKGESFVFSRSKKTKWLVSDYSQVYLAGSEQAVLRIAHVIRHPEQLDDHRDFLDPQITAAFEDLAKKLGRKSFKKHKVKRGSSNEY